MEGKYGLLYKIYLRTHRRVIYINMLTDGTLHEHITDIEFQANEMLECLMRQMATAQGITEALKTTDQMVWVGAMNNIKASAEEIVLKEIVYA